MKVTRRDTLALIGGAAGAAALPAGLSMAASHAADEPMTHEVQMLNRHPDNARERQVFYPDIVRANVGDTIKFVSVDRGHNSEFEPDWSPEGGTEWEGDINGDVEVVVEVEGAYGYKCTPHASAGMVGLLLVGDVTGNYEDLKDERFRGKAKKRFEDIFERADAMLAEEA
ncbi:MAG: plastocyanin/azurin family copper-binding protein [Pseudomonadota bacterium]